MPRYYMGSRITASQIRMGVFTDAGIKIGTWELDMWKGRGCKDTVDGIVDSLTTNIAVLGIAKADMRGLGVSIPGEADISGVVHYCPELGWGIINLKALIEKVCGLPATIGSDRDMAVLGEQWAAGENAPANILGLLFADKLKGGLIVNRQLIYGADGFSGDFGAMPMLDNNQSSSESATLIRGANHEVLMSLYRRMQEDDPLSTKAIHEYISSVVYAIANLCSVVRIDLVIIGGDPSKENRYLAERIKSLYEKLRFVNSPVIRATSLGFDAQLYGSAYHAACIDNHYTANQIVSA